MVVSPFPYSFPSPTLFALVFFRSETVFFSFPKFFPYALQIEAILFHQTGSMKDVRLLTLPPSHPFNFIFFPPPVLFFFSRSSPFLGGGRLLFFSSFFYFDEMARPGVA